MFGIFLVLLALAMIGLLVFNYNTIIKLRNRIENSWAQIDVQLQRRHDLIPNLVETAKGYLKHEQETFKEITKARSKAMQAPGVEQQADAENLLNDAMSKFYLAVEDYPELKANQNFLELQEEITSTENKIAFARQSYNDQVMFFNKKIEVFPSNLLANHFGFKKRDYFEIDDKTREVPEVDFSN